MLVILFFIALLISFYLLAIICDEFFVPALDVLAEKWKLPSDVAGATLMAIGSSAPELMIAFVAVFRGAAHSQIGAGTIVGSAIFNILVIIGASAVYKTAQLDWRPVTRDLLFYTLSILLLLVVFWDGVVSFWEAAGFVALYAVYLGVLMRWKWWFPSVKNSSSDNPIEILEESTEKADKTFFFLKCTKHMISYIIPDVTTVSRKKKYRVALFVFAICIMSIGLLSIVLVESAIILAEAFNVPSAIIALTVIAVGTSIPDLLASVAVARKGRGDMAISNGIGSNIFDILIGLGLPWIFVLGLNQSTTNGITISTENVFASVVLLLATVISVFTLLFLRRWVLGPKAGWLLIGAYLAYLLYNVAVIL